VNRTSGIRSFYVSTYIHVLRPGICCIIGNDDVINFGRCGKMAAGRRKGLIKVIKERIAVKSTFPMSALSIT
jgi:hypothetical protein